MEQYPQAEFQFPLPTFYEDGSIEVHCQVTIGTNMREMWLPVMGNKNEAIKSPDARKINDSKMRCLVKCIAMFGLGHYIYAGEDVPTNTLTKAKARKLYEDLVEGLTKQDSFDAVKTYGDDHTDDVGNLPVDWQEMFRKDFKESLTFWRDKEREGFDGSSDH